MKFQVSMSGFMGQSATLLCVIDDETGVLTIGKSVPYEEKRREGFALVSNMDLPECDFRFVDKLIRDSIRSYFTRLGQEMIAFAPGLQRMQPENRIEREAVDESGPRYRIGDDIDNGQVAVLAAVAFADAQKPLGAVMDAMTDLSDFYGIVTI